MTTRPERCLLLMRQDCSSPPALDDAAIAQVIDQVMVEEGLDRCLLNVLLVDAAASAELHHRHFGDPEPTDVMSFPDGSFDPEYERRNLGDLAICPDVARAVVAQRPGADDPQVRERLVAEECILYLIHGLLHLLGHDDQHDDDRAEMWQRQCALLAMIGIQVADQEAE